jgi:hypothetical protein
MEGYAIGRQNGWLNANDIRALENMNPIPEEEGGNTFLVNGNMVPIGLAGINLAVAAAVAASEAEQDQQETSQDNKEDTEKEPPMKSPQRRKRKKEEQPDESAAHTGQSV